MAVSSTNAIDQAFAILSAELSGFIAQIVPGKLPDGVDWRSLQPEPAVIERAELSAQLQLLTDPHGEYGYVCEDDLTGAALRMAGKLRGIVVLGDVPDVISTLVLSARFLRAIGAANGAAKVDQIGVELQTPSIPVIEPIAEPVVAAAPDYSVGDVAQVEVVVPVDSVDPESTPVADPDEIQILVTATGVLSYAVAHNRVPVIRLLAISNVKEGVSGAMVRIGLYDADGPVGPPMEMLVDLEPDSPTILTNIPFALDPAAMLQIEEQRPGAIRIELLAGERELAELSSPVRLLAANQWLASPLSLALEMLAAFVMPNHPAVTTLMADVAIRLEKTTGSDATQGYQAGPERVDQIVGAIFETMLSAGIRYSNPPASWADIGQKLRTPGDVLEGLVGTCIDTVVVMAAALEHAGIRPLLWIVEGHAFLGYWREEHSLASAAQTEVGDLANLVDLGHIRLVETTLLTGRSSTVSLETAHQMAYNDWISGHFERVMGVTDVYRARKDGIVPLPARRRDQDGNVVVTEYRPVESSRTLHAPATIPISVDRSGPQRSRTPIPPRVAQWKNRLLDLSLRNRLINFTDTARMALTVPAEYLGAFEDSINQGTPFQLLPSDQMAAVHLERGLKFGRELPPDQLVELLTERKSVFTDLSSSAYLSRMRALAYAARTLVEETGANNLYLAFGSLLWNVEGKQLRSPLILVPVQLTAPSRQGLYRLTLDESGMSTPNYCLLEKLRQTHGLEIPELETPAEDGAGIDLQHALQATREALAKHGLPFRVEPTADLAILQFAKFRLWKDLDENWETFGANSLVRHLILTPNEPFADPTSALESADLDLLASQSPMPADSSQLAAVAEATAGRTFVLEGPPGTGKSQTITNLLTRSIAEGKRVLFVAEKRAALDVVQKRLDEVGVGPFCLDLHDKSSRTNEVRARIRAAIDHTVEVDTQGMNVDLDMLGSARGSLVRYARRLHEKNPAGLSFYSARTQTLATGEEIPIFPIGEEFVIGVTPDVMASTRSLLSLLPEAADAAHPQANHPWGFVDAGSPSSLNLNAVRNSGLEFDAALSTLPIDAGPLDVLRFVREPGDLSVLYGILNGSRSPLSILDEAGTAGWQQVSATVLAEISAFGSSQHPGLETVTLAAFELPLQQIHATAVEAEESGFFGRGKRIEAIRDQLAPVLRPGTDTKKSPSELTAKLAVIQRGIQQLTARAQSVRGVTVPPGWNPLVEEHRQEIDRQVRWLGWAGRELDPANRGERTEFVQALRSLVERAPAIAPSDIAYLLQASTTSQRFAAECHVAAGAFARWSGSAGLIVRWRQTQGGRRMATEGLPALQAWLALLQHVEPLRMVRLDEGRRALITGTIDADNAVRAFDRGLADASIRERATATGLDSFDSRTQMRTIERFTTASTAVRNHLVTAVPKQVLDSRTFDVTANPGQVGQLQRQLGRQRGGMGVRSLIANFGELITRIMPCVLVSPDSLSRFFPAKSGLFDIVVFDEASQIRVADAIGAMGRANSVVVVGDSKQMPPTSFAEPSASTEDIPDSALDVVEDEESILSECVQARVPRHWLSWHYRSQDESLIAFSNQQYYESKLSSFPAPSLGSANAGSNGHGISLVRVEGQFHRTGKGALLRTNPIEAEAVASEIRRRFSESPGKLPSIGVVTFNVQQRNLIESLLRDSGDPRLIEALDQAADGLFVKNLENVQGDERDVIFFSTGFSVNERGYLPLNFGPLNRAGGERRLNVAITRARRQIVVFSSFDPEMLRAEETSSIGIKHLRAYLDVAAQGTRALPQVSQRRLAPDRHREEIAEALRGRGYAVRTDVGLSEFKIDLSVAAINEPDRQIMAVLLDGPLWAGRRTVGDRDGLPIEVLSRMLRWPAVERIWMPMWLTDREAVLAEIDTAFTAALARSLRPDTSVAGEVANPNVVPDPELPVVVIPESVDVTPVSITPMMSAVENVIHSVPAPPSPGSSGGLTGAEPLVLWTPRVIGALEVLDALPGAEASQIVAATLHEIVEIEGPIQLDRLARLVAGGFGLARVSAVRNSAILRLLDPDVRADPGDSFAWPSRIDPTRWTGFRPTPAGIDRPIEQISRREIVNAMSALCHASAGMNAEELKREALGVFGGRRMTGNIITALDAALELGLANGRLKPSADGLIVPGTAPA